MFYLASASLGLLFAVFELFDPRPDIFQGIF